MNPKENDLYIPPAFDALDYALLKLLQEEIPLESRPYRTLAEQFGVEEDHVVKRLQTLQEKGALRRVGAILNHNRAGFSINALTAWNAAPKGEESPEEALDRVGQALSQHPAVSHCYARCCPPGWDWPVFAMLHAGTEDELSATLNQLMQAVSSTDMRVMRTLREWKKTSMKYF